MVLKGFFIEDLLRKQILGNYNTGDIDKAIQLSKSAVIMVGEMTEVFYAKTI